MNLECRNILIVALFSVGVLHFIVLLGIGEENQWPIYHAKQILFWLLQIRPLRRVSSSNEDWLRLIKLLVLVELWMSTSQNCVAIKPKVPWAFSGVFFYSNFYQRFVSSIGNMEVILSYLQLIVDIEPILTTTKYVST